MIPPGIRVRRRAPVAPSPARGLTELAESEDADLLVTGSSRHAEPGRIRPQRTAGRLLQGAPCAVAIAPGGLRSEAADPPLGIAYDGSPEADAALHAGYDIASRTGAAVTLMFAIPTGGLDAEQSACVRKLCSTPRPTRRLPASTRPQAALRCTRPGHPRGV